MRRPTGFRGPARPAAHEMRCSDTWYCFFDDVRPSHETAHGLSRAETQAGTCATYTKVSRRRAVYCCGAEEQQSVERRNKLNFVAAKAEAAGGGGPPVGMEAIGPGRWRKISRGSG